MTSPRKVKRTVVTKYKAERQAQDKPKNRTEALAWLRTVAEHIKETYEAHGAQEPPAPVAGDDSYAAARVRRDQWLADRRRLWWFFRAVKVYGSKKNKKSLEQLLGLNRGLGNPVVQERRDKILEKLLKIALLRGTNSPTRKTRQGKPARMSWKEIVRACDMTPKAANRLYQRELSNLNEALAKEIAARLGREPPPIGTAKARNAALGKEITERNRRAP